MSARNFSKGRPAHCAARKAVKKSRAFGGTTSRLRLAHDWARPRHVPAPPAGSVAADAPQAELIARPAQCFRLALSHGYASPLPRCGLAHPGFALFPFG